jgi:acyl-CoA thioester hydrolase
LTPFSAVPYNPRFALPDWWRIPEMQRARVSIKSVSELRVRYAETDRMGVVYHANYLIWCEVGRTDLIRRLGSSYARLEEEGTMLAVADASIRYHAPARYDDEIVVETTLDEVRSRTVTFAYLISRRDGDGLTRLVSARTTLVALDADARPRAMPEPLLSTLRDALAGSDA